MRTRRAAVKKTSGTGNGDAGENEQSGSALAAALAESDSSSTDCELYVAPPTKKKRIASTRKKPKMTAAQYKDDAWQKCLPILTALFKSTKGATVSDFMQYYDIVLGIVYDNNFPVHRRGMLKIAEESRAPVRSPVLTYSTSYANAAAFLYESIDVFVSQHVRTIEVEIKKQDDDEDRLRRYSEEWEKFSLAARGINVVFNYVNTHWVGPEQRENWIPDGGNNVYEIRELCLRAWAQVMFEKNAKIVSKAALLLITNDRNKEAIQDELVKAVVDSLEQIGEEMRGKNVHVSDLKYLELYQNSFEDELLKITSEYYTNEAEIVIQEQSFIKFTIHAEKRLEEEEGRLRRYLSKSSRDKLIKCVENAFIEKHTDKLRDEFKRFLESDNREDLRRLFKLFSRVEGSVTSLHEEFETFVTSRGEEAVKSVTETHYRNTKLERDPRPYIHALLNVYKKYEDLTEDCFEKSVNFGKALRDACVKFFNKNAVTKAAEKPGMKASSILAHFTDSVLRKGGLKISDDELEACLDDAVVCLKFTRDTDVFQNLYIRRLAFRLCTEASVSDSLEELMLLKLKITYGSDFVNRMRMMVTDIKTSAEFMTTFRKESDLGELDSKLEFSAKILRNGTWPIVEEKSTVTLSIPPVIQQYEQKFTEFYVSRHNGRKLFWNLNFARCELQATEFSKNYIFSTTVQQAIILLKFNESTSVAFKDLRTLLAENKNVTEAAVDSLVEAKLLKLPTGQMRCSGLADSAVVVLQGKFTCKKTKVDLCRLFKPKSDLPKNNKKNDEDTRDVEAKRRLLTRAAIVRVMKTRKVLNHDILFTEVVEQVDHFKPDVKTFKDAVEFLIDSQYLERDVEDRKKYKYM